MQKEVLYQYLGTNGSILSPVHLEDIYYVRKIHIVADKDKVITKNGKTFEKAITVPEEDADNWYEVDGQN